MARAVCSVHCATNEHTFTVYRCVCAAFSESGWNWWILAIQLQNILCIETGMRIKGLVQIQTMHCIFVQSGEGEDFGEAGRENDSLANYV